MKLKFPETITIGDNTFKVITDKESTVGFFTYWEENKKGKPTQGNITIGTFHLKNNPIQVLTIIIHELKEIIQVEQCVRYTEPSTDNNYEFHYSHKTHTDLCRRLSQALSLFIDWLRTFIMKKIIYRSTKFIMPYCPSCKNMLSGNGSVIMPYYCKCGKWKPLMDNYKFKGEYEIIKQKKEEKWQNGMKAKEKN